MFSTKSSMIMAVAIATVGVDALKMDFAAAIAASKESHASEKRVQAQRAARAAAYDQQKAAAIAESLLTNAAENGRRCTVAAEAAEAVKDGDAVTPGFHPILLHWSDSFTAKYDRESCMVAAEAAEAVKGGDAATQPVDAAAELKMREELESDLSTYVNTPGFYKILLHWWDSYYTIEHKRAQHAIIRSLKEGNLTVYVPVYVAGSPMGHQDVEETDDDGIKFKNVSSAYVAFGRLIVSTRGWDKKI